MVKFHCYQCPVIQNLELTMKMRIIKSFLNFVSAENHKGHVKILFKSAMGVFPQIHSAHGICDGNNPKEIMASVVGKIHG